MLRCLGGFTLLFLSVIASYADEETLVRKIMGRGGRVERDEKADGKPIVMIRLGTSKPVDDLAADIGKVTTLKTLDLTYGRLSDEGFKHFVDLKGLVTLRIGGTKVTDASFKIVEGFTKLKELELRDTDVTGEGLAFLKGTKGLDLLYLTKGQLNDRGLHHLAALGLVRTVQSPTGSSGRPAPPDTELTETDLSQSAITDQGLQALKGLTKLKTIRLNSTQVTGVGFKELKNLPISTVELNESPVSAEGLATLQQYESLSTLRLAFTKAGDDDMKLVKGMKNLMYLDLRLTPISDKAFGEIKELKNLNILWAVGTKMSDEGLKELEGLERLRELYIQGTGVTNDGINRFRQRRKTFILK
jgi:internalin A